MQHPAVIAFRSLDTSVNPLQRQKLLLVYFQGRHLTTYVSSFLNLCSWNGDKESTSLEVCNYPDFLMLRFVWYRFKWAAESKKRKEAVENWQPQVDVEWNVFFSSFEWKQPLKTLWVWLGLSLVGIRVSALMDFTIYSLKKRWLCHDNTTFSLSTRLVSSFTFKQVIVDFCLMGLKLTTHQNSPLMVFFNHFS